jgi:hypothetical protein
MTSCGFQWVAPWHAPPSAPKADAEFYRAHRPSERCILERGHEGDHRSLANVTAANPPRKIVGKVQGCVR